MFFSPNTEEKNIPNTSLNTALFFQTDYTYYPIMNKLPSENEIVIQSVHLFWPGPYTAF